MIVLSCTQFTKFTRINLINLISLMSLITLITHDCFITHPIYEVCHGHVSIQQEPNLRIFVESDSLLRLHLNLLLKTVSCITLMLLLIYSNFKRTNHSFDETTRNFSNHNHLITLITLQTQQSLKQAINSITLYHLLKQFYIQTRSHLRLIFLFQMTFWMASEPPSRVSAFSQTRSYCNLWYIQLIKLAAVKVACTYLLCSAVRSRRPGRYMHCSHLFPSSSRSAPRCISPNRTQAVHNFRVLAQVQF